MFELAPGREAAADDDDVRAVHRGRRPGEGAAAGGAGDGHGTQRGQAQQDQGQAQQVQGGHQVIDGEVREREREREPNQYRRREFLAMGCSKGFFFFSLF